MSTVYVVMSNDFPDAVFSDERKADAYVEKKRQERKPGFGRPIFWRWYDFHLDAENQNVV